MNVITSLKTHSLSRNLAVSLSTALIIIGLIAFSLFYWFSKYQAKLNLEKSSGELLNAISESLSLPLWDVDERQINTICYAYVRNDLVGAIKVARFDGYTYFDVKKSDFTLFKQMTAPIVHKGEQMGMLTLNLASDYYDTLNSRFFLFYSATLLLMIVSLFIIIHRLLGTYLHAPLAQFVSMVESYALNYDHSVSKKIYTEFEPLQKIMREMGEKIKRSLTALKESEEKYRVLYESFPLGITVTDPSGGILETNRIAEKLLGVPKSDHEQRSIEDEEWFIIKPDGRPMPSGEYAGAKALKNNCVVENQEIGVIKPDGCTTWLIVTAAPIPLEKYGVAIAYGDITDRKKAETELRESEEKYRKLVTTAPYGIQLTDRAGKILFSNPAHHRIQGCPDGELIGKYFWEMKADDGSRSRARDFYQKMINEQPVPEVCFDRDFTRDGREIDVRINWDYIRNSEGEVDGIISIISDITKQKALESSVRDAQRMESIGILAGGIAHDFNNILFPIVGMSELLMEDLAQDSIGFENAKEIFKAGKRGSDLVKQILAFSRQSEHKKMPTRFQNVLKEVIQLSRSTIPSYIEISQNIQQDCGMIMADATQLHQIGMNIITNAYHALEDGGGRISITLQQRELEAPESSELNVRSGTYAILSVSDTGHGMPKELVEKIFDPYFTTKEQGKGTGLGLAMVYGIVKEHGGAIKVYSEIHKGTTFRIYLPLMKKYIGAESIPEAEEHKGGNERILLIDDEESVAKLEKLMLERMGYTVVSHLHSVEALEVFRADPTSYDLVITDMSMPNIPGDELARKIKEIRSDVPIIICTGYSERIHKDSIKHLGINGLLMKPIVRSELAEAVRKVLDQTGAEKKQ